MAKKGKISGKDPAGNRGNQFGHVTEQSRYGNTPVLAEDSSNELELETYDGRETLMLDKPKLKKEKEPFMSGKPVETEGEYKSFMAGELSVATDKHDVKAEEGEDGRHVLKPESKAEPGDVTQDKAEKEAPAKDKKDPAKEIGKHKEKHKNGKHGGKDHGQKEKGASKEKHKGKEKGTDAKNSFPEKAVSPPAVTPAENSKTILDLNKKPPTEAEVKTVQQSGPQAEQEALARKQAFQAEVEQAKGALRAQMTEQKAAIRASYGEKKQQIAAEASARKEAVRAGVGAAKARTQVAYAQMLAHLQEKLAADIAKVNTDKQEKLKALTDGITKKKTDFTTYIQQKQAEPIEFARSEGTRIQSELTAAADLCIQQSSQVAASQSKDEGKQAATKVGEESAKDIRAKIAPMQQNVLDLGNELKGNYTEYQAKVNEELDKSQAELQPVIENLAQETIQKLQSDHDAMQQAQLQAKEKDLQALDAIQSGALSEIQKEQAEANRGLEKSFDQSNTSLEQLGKTLLSGMDHLKADTMQSLGGPGKVYLPGFIAVLDDAQVHLQQMQSTGDTILRQQTATATEGFASTAAGFEKQATSTATGATQSAAKHQEQSKKRMDESFSKYSKQADKNTEDFNKQAQQSLDEGMKEIDTSIQKVREKIEEQNREAKEKLTARTNENIDKAKSPLKDDNRSRSEQAAAKASNTSWWDVVKGVFAAIITIAIMFVVVVIVAALIVAALAAIGLTVGLWTVVAIIGIGFLLYAGYKSYQKRSQQMKEGKLSGWGVFGMVISDSIGITDIYESVRNKDMVTGEDLGLGGYERGFRFTNGAFTLVMTVVGVRGGVKGIRTKMAAEGGLFEGLGAGLKELPGKLKAPSWEGFKGGLGESIGEVTSAVKGVWKGVKDFFGNKSKGTEPELNTGDEGLNKKEDGEQKTGTDDTEGNKKGSEEQKTGEETPPSKKEEGTDTPEPENNSENKKGEDSSKTETEDTPDKPDKDVTGQKYLELAKKAYEIYSKQLDSAIGLLQDIIGKFGSISGRAKRPESAANRLLRAEERFNKKINTVEDAIDNTWDALGTRIVLKDASPEAISAMVADLCEAIRAGKIKVTMANSLTGKGGNPYLTEAHLAQLRAAGASVNTTIDTSMREYDTGYTVATIYVEYANGVKGEIQIIGEKVLQVANAEHLPYDAFLNKPYADAYKPESIDQVKALIEPIRKAAQSLDPAQKSAYNAYLNECYKAARGVESNVPSPQPELPPGVPKELSIDNLLKVEQATKKYKK